jgi:hypothetical protein
MQIELPGRRAWPGGHCTPGVGSGIPGVELPGRPGVEVPGILGVGLPGMVGVVGPGVGMPGVVVPPPGAGVWAPAVPARIRLVAIAASDVFPRMRSILVMTISGARRVPRAYRGIRGAGGADDGRARAGREESAGGLLPTVEQLAARDWPLTNGPLTLSPEGRAWEG